MEKEIRDLIESPLLENGIKVYEINTIEEEGNNIIEVVIDSESEVDVNMCVKASGIINELLDSYREDYEIDVCSKGVEDEQ